MRTNYLSKLMVLWERKKDILKISVQKIHNDIILPSFEGVFLVQEQFMEKIV